MLSINLAPIFRIRGIDRPYHFLIKAGFTSHSATSILQGTTRSFRLDHVERLCRALVCEPNDLLAFTPESQHPLPADHPLNNLKPAPMPNAIKDTLATLPFKQLKQLTDQINKTT